MDVHAQRLCGYPMRHAGIANLKRGAIPFEPLEVPPFSQEGISIPLVLKDHPKLMLFRSSL
jgi:hypothetical protein